MLHHINVNIRGPTLYSFISQGCVSVVSAFVSDTENMALILSKDTTYLERVPQYMHMCIVYSQATY